ncbi:MAG: 1-deoxy-D-xylulose-5-phosphate reductoisomerase [Bacteroidales bacterium]|jgi:1-deoxy-D-xylulose-5-phosphate reductoisomerase|nr:1-deoxy-D-xylulose-5-phosphate reductoisomerase [Bacteroidales bacterium]
MRRGIAILGSTGSIGTQAIEVCESHPDVFRIELLTARQNSKLLIEQAIKLKPNSVVIADEEKYKEVNDALFSHDIKVFTGMDSINSLVKGEDIDIVLTAMVGFSGLEPTLSAIKAGKAIALANKETLVAAGELVIAMAKESGSPIIPVDSEHSAIFQCLQGERSKAEKLILTASGGPFLGKTLKELERVSVEEALNHPNWKMGSKVTVDSATMMNKGLEMIEARWLFNMNPADIEIVVHPQSIIHSMVQFRDGSVTAQMSTPDMRLPIQYALAYPNRLELDTKRVNFSELGRFDFFKPDLERFPCINIAYDAISRGGNIPCAMNAGNEIAVEAFLNGKISFTQIHKVTKEVVNGTMFVAQPKLSDILNTDKTARIFAAEIVNKFTAK